MVFLSTQLPDFILQELPDVLHSQIHRSMFNSSYHYILNYFCFAQVIIGMVASIYHGRITPKSKAPESWWIKQFNILIFFHGLFYIVELLVTQMTLKFSNMAIHHLVALAIFYVFLDENTNLSFLTMLPFFFHALYWVSGAEGFILLSIYNWVFLFVGTATTYVYINTQGGVSWRVPVLCVVEVGVNQFTYCTDFQGHYCPVNPHLLRGPEDYLSYLTLAIFCLGCIITVCKLNFFFAARLVDKNRSGEKEPLLDEYYPSHEKKLQELDIDNSLQFRLQGIQVMPRRRIFGNSRFIQTSSVARMLASDKYKKLDQKEHILLRPDTYIGSVEAEPTILFSVKPNQNCISLNKINFVPGLYKLFDEILSNAADNKVRDPKMSTIKVNIDTENNSISIYNDGKGIPVEIHSKEGIYIPELIFGHLLTSSNYDDDEKKITGGRNGYGAKLCNIFSKEFIVETSHSESGHKFKQVFKKNMSISGKPVITQNASKDFTKITFKPDLSRFSFEDEVIPADFEQVLKKRVYDIAGCIKGVKVYYNGSLIKVKTFQDYCKLYLNPENADTDSMEIVQENNEKEDDEDDFIDDDSKKKKKKKSVVLSDFVGSKKILAYDKNDRWEVCVSSSDGTFRQVSFVNSICTLKGGTHVNYITDQLIAKIAETLTKKTATASSTTALKTLIKNQLFIFINCFIENPTFDSQTKDHMTLKASKFGSKFVLSPDFVKKVLKSDIVTTIQTLQKERQEKQLKKTDGTKKQRISGISKLDDANWAGAGKKSQECTLILTEGDSAKSLAISGLSVVGRDSYGVFPLRGKLLNVREASSQQVLKNEEITNIKRILGLQQGKVYNSTESLRYGHVMIMADQDHDGSHIKGLILNLFDHFWPSLLRIPGFMLQFITPIVKVAKGSREVCFYTLPEYEAWREENENGKGWTIKYYKGLGTSTAADAKKYFTNMRQHVRPFAKAYEDDRFCLDLAFGKKRADERKEWLRGFVPGTFMDNQIASIKVSEFVNKELILHSMADNIRSIPSAIDGLKPGHRKILFACLKRNLVKGELKVAQLAGYVSEHSAYHHGENSLAQTIIGLAQDYVGSNNINMLEPLGQFGTRLLGGKDNAAPRYIFTRLTEITRKIFHVDDDKLLKYRADDGMSIEPDWYIPIIPMALVNGSEGIGTGWSTFSFNYNPKDIVENLLMKLQSNRDFQEMQPWYKGFTGKIEKIGAEKYSITGVYTKLDEATIEITELPIGSWTQPYKEYLELLLAGSEKVEPFIKDFKEYHTETNVNFVVTLAPSTLAQLEKEGEAAFLKKFKLITTKTTSNMVLFDSNETLKKYKNSLEILEEFYALRLDFYHQRKRWLETELEIELKILESKVRFLMELMDGTIVVQNKKKKDVFLILKSRGYYEKRSPSAVTEPTDLEDEKVAEANGNCFDYLLSMTLWSLTEERIQKLIGDRDAKKLELEDIIGKSAQDLWINDLNEFLVSWEESLLTHDKKASETSKNKKKSATRKASMVKVLKQKPRKMSLDDSDDFESDCEADEFTLSSKSSRKTSKAPSQEPLTKPSKTGTRRSMSSSSKSTTIPITTSTSWADSLIKKKFKEAPKRKHVGESISGDDEKEETRSSKRIRPEGSTSTSPLSNSTQNLVQLSRKPIVISDDDGTTAELISSPKKRKISVFDFPSDDDDEVVKPSKKTFKKSSRIIDEISEDETSGSLCSNSPLLSDKSRRSSSKPSSKLNVSFDFDFDDEDNFNVNDRKSKKFSAIDSEKDDDFDFK